MTMRSTTLLFLGFVLAACGSNDGGSGDASRNSAGGSATTTTAGSGGDIVGRWRRINNCRELVAALADAGLAPVAASVVGDYFPDTSAKQLATKGNLCQGAEPFVHYHFFDASGRFGSLDDKEQPVDDGPYKTVDERTFVIPFESVPVRFHYAIDGASLKLSPVITPAMKRDALAHPLKFTAAGWAISVSYPDHEWMRVDCGAWC
jgi:hypothetical protein